MAPSITANRKITLQNPSVVRAEFQHEIDGLNMLKSKLSFNIEMANAKQREKLQKLKYKYDQDGVNYVDEEKQLGRSDLHP